MHSADRPRAARVILGSAVFAAVGFAFALVVARLAERSATELEADDLLGALRAVWIAIPLAAAVVGWRLLREPASRRWHGLAQIVSVGAIGGLLTPLGLAAVELLRRHHRPDAHDVALCFAGLLAGAVLALVAAPVALYLARFLRPLVHREVSWRVSPRVRAIAAVAGAALVVAILGASLFQRGARNGPSATSTPAPNTNVRPSDDTKRLVTAPGGNGEGEAGDGSADSLRRERVARFVNSVRGMLEEEARAGLENLILGCDRDKLLPDLFEALVDNRLYEPVVGLLMRGAGGQRTPALDALVHARPDLRERSLNAPTLAALRSRADWDEYPYQVLIVPGYTPIKADRELSIDEIPAAQKRCDLAIADYRAGLAPYILVSGGAVHPAGTRYNEAISMHTYLTAHGIPADHILVDAHARHSTTNLRNAGRMMLDYNMKRGLIVTGFESRVFDQAFYFANPVLSSFERRCRRELGFMVGELRGVDDHHIDFVPAREVATINYVDPFDG